MRKGSDSKVESDPTIFFNLHTLWDSVISEKPHAV